MQKENTDLKIFALANLQKINTRKLFFLLSKISIEELFYKDTLKECVCSYLKMPKIQFNWHLLEKQYLRFKRLKIHLISYKSDKYPKELLHIANPPLLLYARGSLDILKNTKISVVGSRKPSYQAQVVAKEICNELAYKYNFVLVSGLALGIDSVAHRASIKKTIAVLPGHVEEVYPRSNLLLSEKIIEEGGLLLSEVANGTAVCKASFPRRNRIITGLSKGTLIVEAGVKSGTMLSAKYAIEQNKELFVIPFGPKNENALGSNLLIKQGAALVTSAKDIVEELSY